MTQRKPPRMTWPGWVERQIRVAEERGAFENLPGKGKPIADLDAPSDDLNWVVNYLRRENADITAILPPALALAKEVDELPARLATQRSETAVRAVVDDLNQRIRAAHRRPHDGPPVRVWVIDVDAAVQRWRDERPPPPAPVVEPPVVPVRRRRWRRI